MTINLIHIICFSLISIFLYHTIAKKYATLFLFVVSMVFYLLIDPGYFLLLSFLIVVSYFLIEIANLFIGRKRRAVCWLTILFIVLTLAYYKFLPKSLFEFQTDIIMPIGMSYFSFKMISYIVDVGIKGIKQKRYSLLEYAVYISLFSQIISGPITRISEFEFDNGYRKLSKEEVEENIALIISGMFKKLVIAERLAIYTDYCFSNFKSMPTIALWMNMFFYSIQIYCDFCGYSEIAIGITRLLGMRCGENFCIPYFSLTIKEFWNRWHISLSHWLRDYIYIPLGGNKKEQWRKVRNVMIVFAISGVWHGNSWNYLVWGIWHAIFQMFSPRKECIKNKLKKTLCHMFTLIVVAVGWVFFYYTNVKDAFAYIGNMCKEFDISIKNIILTIMPFTQDYACFAHFLIVCIMIYILFFNEWKIFRKIKCNYRLNTCVYIVSIILFGIFGQNSFIYANF